MELIDKNALVAEIERLKTIYNDDENIHHVAKYNILVDILSFLNTLEVKEMNLEKELDYDDYVNFFKEHPDYSNGDWGFDECWVFAKYFFELGLRTSQPTTSVYGIEEALKENGIDPDSKEADMYREAIYKIYDRLKAQKGE